MRVAVLPEELSVDLSLVDEERKTKAMEWQGITAVVRPLDELEAARWQDAFPKGFNEASLALVRRQLVRIEGVTVGDGDAPFDLKNPLHFSSVFAVGRGGPIAINRIFGALLARTKLDEPGERNLDSPSGSGTTTGTDG